MTEREKERNKKLKNGKKKTKSGIYPIEKINSLYCRAIPSV